MGGQIRIRIRFQDIKGPWFDYLLVSPTELKGILAGTGWRLQTILRDGGPLYVAVVRNPPLTGAGKLRQLGEDYLVGRLAQTCDATPSMIALSVGLGRIAAVVFARSGW